MSGRTDEPWITLIGGPTASGKSALALRLAEETGAEIVNADSMQVYADLRVLTARPTEAEEARVLHHLYGVADGDDPWSVGRWLRAALPVLQRLRSAGRQAIVVGGTGLYFRALTRGLADTPDVPDAARSEAAARLEALGEPAFRDELARVDPEAEARIAAGDRQRLIRARAVSEATGRPLTAWQAETTPPFPAAAWRARVLEPARPELYARCDARVSAMVDGGALEEVRALAARGLDPTRPVMKAVGVGALIEHLAGRRTLEHAVQTMRQETRNYAKRQLTWFRNQTPDWPRSDPFTRDSSEAPQ